MNNKNLTKKFPDKDCYKSKQKMKINKTYSNFVKSQNWKNVKPFNCMIKLLNKS